MLILKILAKKLVFSIFLLTTSGIASVSHPSLIISRAPKDGAKFFSKSSCLPALFLSIFLIFGPKKLVKHFSILKNEMKSICFEVALFSALFSKDDVF